MSSVCVAAILFLFNFIKETKLAIFWSHGQINLPLVWPKRALFERVLGLNENIATVATVCPVVPSVGQFLLSLMFYCRLPVVIL